MLMVMAGQRRVWPMRVASRFETPYIVKIALSTLTKAMG
jgi:hypothetical protein